MSGYRSNRAAYRAGFAAEVGRRVKAASAYLAGAVKADVSQPGTLRYRPHSERKGRKWLRQKTVYNFTHSRPGNPPFKQTGALRRSISYEVLGLTGRVGSAIKDPRYPYYLELGTKRMAPRPYLRRALAVHRAALRAILLKRIPGGGLPAVVSNQFRPGHFGRGAARSGWARG